MIDAGLIWIGPPPEVIAAMGDKLSAKKLMAAAGVPTLPAAELAADADERPRRGRSAIRCWSRPRPAAAAAACGSCAAETDLAAAIASARREAAAAFGDDTVFLERWLESSRHVEIQILGDQHGHLVHCFERECSIQRRHQKIIEEAPSPSARRRHPRRHVRRRALGRPQARLFVRGHGGIPARRSREFWFLEVNARLQVEHPVTEAIIGKDLVREQIRIAEGEPLSFSKETSPSTAAPSRRASAPRTRPAASCPPGRRRLAARTERRRAVRFRRRGRHRGQIPSSTP